MKLINKLALVAAMSVSANAMALQSMDDEALSATTGQDGITLQVFTNKIDIAKLIVHDNDGLSSTATINYTTPVVTSANPAYDAAKEAAIGDPTDPNHDPAYTTQSPTITTGGTSAINLGGTEEAGAIIIKDVVIEKDSAVPNTTALATLKIDTDGGTAADGSGAFLNVGVDLAATNISVGKISVGKSNAGFASNAALKSASGARRGATEVASNEILEGLTLGLGATKMNIQLGAQPQGALIMLDGTMTGGLMITDLVLKDGDGVAAAGTPNGLQLAAIGGAPGVAGELAIDALKVTSSGQADLTSSAKINLDKNLGLAVTLGNGQFDTYVRGVHLGDRTAPSIGDVEIQGLNLNGSTLFVKGH